LPREPVAVLYVSCVETKGLIPESLLVYSDVSPPSSMCDKAGQTQV